MASLKLLFSHKGVNETMRDSSALDLKKVF